MPASKAINTGDSSSIYWPWPPQKLSVCITMDFDEHTIERRRGGWVSKVGALTAVAWMQKKKSATSVHPLAVGWWALRAVFNLHFCESDPCTPPCKLASKIGQQ